MEVFSERAGMEFDWFAIDAAGHVAVFATAGCGPVPSQVRADAAKHDLVGDQIEVAGWGTSAVWESYAMAGLFAYDWDDLHQRYSRVACPSHLANERLSSRLAGTALPHLALSFQDSPTIAVNAA